MPSPKLLEAILRALAGAGRGTKLSRALHEAPRLARMLPGRGGRALPGLESAADVAPDIARVARGPVRTAMDVAPPGMPELRMAGEGLPPYPGRTPGRGLVEELSDRELAEAVGEAWRRQQATGGVPARPARIARWRGNLAEIQSEWMRRRGTGAGLEASLMGEGPPPRRLPSVSEFDQLDAAVLEGMDVSMGPGRGERHIAEPAARAKTKQGPLIEKTIKKLFPKTDDLDRVGYITADGGMRGTAVPARGKGPISAFQEHELVMEALPAEVASEVAALTHPGGLPLNAGERVNVLLNRSGAARVGHSGSEAFVELGSLPTLAQREHLVELASHKPIQIELRARGIAVGKEASIGNAQEMRRFLDDLVRNPPEGFGPAIISDAEAAAMEGLDVADLDRISEHGRRYIRPAEGAEKAIREAEELPPMQRRLLARAGKPSKRFQIVAQRPGDPLPSTAIVLNDGTVIGSARGPRAPVPHTDLVTGPRKGGLDYLGGPATKKRISNVVDFMDEGGVRLAASSIEGEGAKRTLYAQCAGRMTDEQVRALAPHLENFEVLVLDTGYGSVAIAHPTAAKLRVALRMEARKSLPGLQGLYS